MAIQVKDVRITSYAKGNILGFVELVVNDELGAQLRLAEIAIKKTREGSLLLSYAKRTDREDSAYWNPLDKRMAGIIEKAVFEELTRIKNFMPGK